MCSAQCSQIVKSLCTPSSPHPPLLSKVETPQMDLFRRRPHTGAAQRKKSNEDSQARNQELEMWQIRNQELEMWQILEKCWCVACGRRRRLFHSGALLTKPLSLEECPGHAEARLPLKANVHRLRLALWLYFDFDFKDYKTQFQHKHQIRYSDLYLWTCKRCRFDDID